MGVKLHPPTFRTTIRISKLQASKLLVLQMYN